MDSRLGFIDSERIRIAYKESLVNGPSRPLYEHQLRAELTNVSTSILERSALETHIKNDESVQDDVWIDLLLEDVDRAFRAIATGDDASYDAVLTNIAAIAVRARIARARKLKHEAMSAAAQTA